MQKPSYHSIKKDTPNWPIRQSVLVEWICMWISPYFSRYFIAWNLRPNTVTMFMITFGVVGSIIFCFPPLPCKIIGCLCFWMWYIMDCSDGEVARSTKQFSKYGVEMDFMAHLISHPLMNFSFWLTYTQMDKYNSTIITILFLIFGCTELISRNIIDISIYQMKKEGSGRPLLPFYKYLFNQLSCYPNIALFLSIFIILDIGHIIDSEYILYVLFSTHLGSTANLYIKTLVKYYKSK